MRKKFFRGFPVYALFLANFVHAVLNGFDWLFCVAAVLTLAMLALDIWEAVINHA